MRHVVAFSSGNHAQGVARAVTTRGIKATIVMPEDTPATKIEGTKAYGADVITYTIHGSAKILASLSKKYNANLIKPYDDVRVIAGQGLWAGNLNRCRNGIAPDAFCCCGGGGLLQGLSCSSCAYPETVNGALNPNFMMILNGH